MIRFPALKAMMLPVALMRAGCGDPEPVKTGFIARLKRQARNGVTLKKAVLQLRDVQGLQQLLSVNAHGDRERQNFHITIRNGQFVRQ
jgi:hypothetical protein|tara:strand:+ start:2585 stop:2848 length:264 start_codon:yes stop_codon:yes gene_type:complete